MFISYDEIPIVFNHQEIGITKVPMPLFFPYSGVSLNLVPITLWLVCLWLAVVPILLPFLFLLCSSLFQFHYLHGLFLCFSTLVALLPIPSSPFIACISFLVCCVFLIVLASLLAWIITLFSNLPCFASSPLIPLLKRWNLWFWQSYTMCERKYETRLH